MIRHRGEAADTVLNSLPIYFESCIVYRKLMWGDEPSIPD